MVRWTLVVLMTTLVTAGCDSAVVKGNGRSRHEKRDLSSFQTAVIRTSLPVRLQQGVPAKAEITTDGNLLPHLRTLVENGNLSVSSDKELIPAVDSHIRLVGPDVNTVTHAGQGPLQINLVDAAVFTVNHKNTGPVTAAGSARRLFLNVEGSGQVDTRAVTAEEVAVTVTRDADVTVTANRRAVINHYGSGTVTVYGAPEDVENNNRGSGRVVVPE